MDWDEDKFTRDKIGSVDDWRFLLLLVSVVLVVQFPKLLGQERRLNLRDGSLTDTWYVAGLPVRSQTFNSGLEDLFNYSSQMEFEDESVVIYLRALTQPPRGGAIHILALSRNIYADVELTEAETVRLIQMVRSHDEIALKKWHREIVDVELEKSSS